MSRTRLEYLDPDPPDRRVGADVLVREEPDKEDEQDEQDEEDDDNGERR